MVAQGSSEHMKARVGKTHDGQRRPMEPDAGRHDHNTVAVDGLIYGAGKGVVSTPATV